MPPDLHHRIEEVVSRDVVYDRDIVPLLRLQEGFRNVILGIDITGWQKRREEES